MFLCIAISKNIETKKVESLQLVDFRQFFDQQKLVFVGNFCFLKKQKLHVPVSPRFLAYTIFVYGKNHKNDNFYKKLYFLAIT